MKKQAVILIHGVGEQVPMDTLRGFVETAWTDDASLRRPKVPATVWSKPDFMSDDLELRRMTTAENRERRRTDFFEFYWAHLMRQTTWAHVRAWVGVLLLRRPSRVPAQLRPIWWGMAALLAGVAALAVARAIHPSIMPPWLPALAGLASLVFGGLVSLVVLRIAGDAARYLHVAPANIDIRRNIRHDGLRLLHRLHASGDYDRIIIVGHSLGSVIGYDLITHYWARLHDSPGDTASNAPDEIAALEKLEDLARLAARTPADFRIDEYQDAQTAYFDALRKRDHPWLISDFITLGSPLAHAPYLLAKSEEDLRRKITEREFPACPPALEPLGDTPRFTYMKDGLRVPHHAAPFAPTRWTNLYFPCRHVVRGDFVGGPVAPAFGPGVKDAPVRTNILGGFLNHTHYWTLPRRRRPDAPAPAWIAALRHAVRLVKSTPPPAP